ncbi:DUF4347 domain-containing protein, partial [Microcoleus sp. S13_C5]|uniref:DUF4347 domain-containing protein n=1 Tax=Microcoleus sp. S13_C5 TaxID=3055411 RepID=UPI002FCF5FE9
MNSPTTNKQIIFVYSSVQDYQSLIQNTDAAQIFVLNENLSGIEQITNALANQKDIEAVHILSHGSEGSVKLGTDVLNGNDLEKFNTQLKHWGNALTEDGDILLYGCDVAAGETGHNFVKQLSELTGADVAASNDLTGNAAQGGDWDLEIATGKIEAAVPFNREAMEDYDYTLANFNVTVATDDGTGTVAGTLSKAILDANSLAGDDTITLTNSVRFTQTPNQLIDSNIAFSGGGFTVSGDANNSGSNNTGDVRPFFVKSGIVDFSNMTISGGRAQGGNGSGGGAGMGGGLFVYNGTVSLNSVTFSNNSAIGGNGGVISSTGGGANFVPLNPANNGANITGTGGTGGFGGNGGNGTGGSGSFVGGTGVGGSGGFGGGGGVGSGGSGSFVGGTGVGGSGGFGGGGGSGVGGSGGGGGLGGNGGYGGGGGGGTASGVGSGGTFGGDYKGGGAGLGGAVFIRQGTLILNSTIFTSNTATGGTGGNGGSNPGRGKGGAIFAMQSLTNSSNGNNQGMPTVLPTVRTLGATFTSNTAANQASTPTANTPANGQGVNQDNNDVYGSINTAPVLADTVVTLSTILEDAVAPTGAVGNLISSIAAIGTGQNNIIDPDTGAVAGIAITAADTTNGSWSYTIDGGTTWKPLGAVSDTNARLLAANANTRIYFQPTANYNGTVTNGITFRAWDTLSGTNGGTANTSTNGGSTVFSTATDTAAITVTAVNDIPSFTATNPTVNEDAGAQTVTNWATFNAGAADESAQTATYTVSNISNSALFATAPAIDANGNLTYTPATDANGTSTFDVKVQDSGGTANGGVDTSTTQTFTITVNSVNDQPSFTAINPTTVNEDAGAQTVTNWATFNAGAANEAAQTATYTVSNIGTPSLFATAPAIDANGNLTYTPATDANGTSTFDVKVQDSGGTANGGVDTSTTQTFTITVNSVNDQPSFTAINPTTVNEDAGAQTVTNWATFNPHSADVGGIFLSVVKSGNPKVFPL